MPPRALDFNLAHTGGMIVCAVTGGRPVGVDVEDNRRQADYGGLARRFFAAAEAAAWEALPPARQPAAFFAYWTLKEAWMKARGKGFALGLSSFAFSLEEGRPPRIELADDGPQAAAGWQFARLRLAGRFEVALAMDSAEPSVWSFAARCRWLGSRSRSRWPPVPATGGRWRD